MTELRAWVVVLLGTHNPADIKRGLSVVYADSAEDAVYEAHDVPPSIFSVKSAWVCELATPYDPTYVPVAVPKPEWGRARPALKGKTR